MLIVVVACKPKWLRLSIRVPYENLSFDCIGFNSLPLLVLVLVLPCPPFLQRVQQYILGLHQHGGQLREERRRRKRRHCCCQELQLSFSLQSFDCRSKGAFTPKAKLFFRATGSHEKSTYRRLWLR